MSNECGGVLCQLCKESPVVIYGEKLCVECAEKAKRCRVCQEPGKDLCDTCLAVMRGDRSVMK